MSKITETKIKKFPYLGYSHNLIECFNIIGFMEVHMGDIIKEIKKISHNNNNEKTIKNKNQNISYFKEFKSKIDPIIINTISSNFQNGNLIDFDLLIKSIFPSLPSIYYNKTDNNKDLKPENYNVIVYLNNEQKNPIYSFSLIFYEMIQIPNNLKIYIPKCFNILSQYPYFIEFNKLFEQIYKSFKINNQEIPLEIMLYNIINFTPSPINHEIFISLFPNKELISYEKEVQKQENEKSKDENKLKNKSNLNQLSGYPYLHFNLTEIFKIVSIHNIIKLIVYNFIESKIIFFSHNLEILNIIMYLISQFNYPCNDSSSISSIISISKKEFVTHNIQFLNNINSNFFGVKTKFKKEEFRTIINKYYSDSFIIDLDNDDFEFYGKNEQLNKLITYIEKILEEKKMNSIFLERNIKILYKDFKDITSKISNSNYGENNEEETAKFFLFDNQFIPKNKIIQEKVYDFILNLLSVFHNCFKLSFQKEINNGEIINKYNLTYKNEKLLFENWSEEEKIFANYFFISNNWKKYFQNFLTNNIFQELYTIPYIFSEEFITVNKIGKNVIKYYFDIIDKFYFNKSNTENVDFNNFYIYYEKHLKNYVFNESKMSKKLKIDYNINQGKIKIGYKYKITELDQNILFSYIHFIENLEESELLNIFPSINLQKELKIKETTTLSLTQYIQDIIINQKSISYEEILCFNCLSIFILICDNIDICSHFEYLFTKLNKHIFLFRRIINLILSINYKLSLKKMEVDYLKRNLLIYSKIMDFLIKNNIIPDNILWNLIKQFKEIELIYNKMTKDINEKFDNTKEYPNDIELKFKTFLRYNYCKDGIIEENYFIELSKKTNLNSDLTEQCQKCNLLISPKIFIKDLSNPSNKYLINLFTPKKIYEDIKKIIKMFYANLQKTNEIKNHIQEIIKNLIFYTNAYNMNKNLQNFLFSLIEN